MNYRTPETHSSNSSKYKHHEERGREICFHTNLPVTPFFFFVIFAACSKCLHQIYLADFFAL